MRKLRTLALASQHSRLLVVATLWLALFAYAGRPLLIGAAAAGISRTFAWLMLLAIASLPLLVKRRTPLATWIGHATLAVFSTLLVLVPIGDVIRIALPILDRRTIAFAILGSAGALSLVGWMQARCPRVKRVEIALENLPPELDGYRIVQWSDVHIGPTIGRRFLEMLVERTNALDADAIAITGDFVDGPLDRLRDEIAPLDDLRARD